ncbi:MAG: hypothetical protein JWR75_1589 [Devosia sp.]|nr:hypothetical protein [Devosia sp.]
MNLRTVALSLLLLATIPGTPVLAQTATGKSCSLIQDEARRLLCYDLVFRAGAGGPDAELTSAPSFANLSTSFDPNWPLRTESSKLGQGLALTLTTRSLEPISGDDQMGEVSINCDDNRTSLSFVFPGYFIAPGDGGNILTASVDGSGKASYETIASDSIMILFGGTKSLPLLQQMLAGDTLDVSVKASSGETVAVSYALKGLGEAIAPLRQACNW